VSVQWGPLMVWQWLAAAGVFFGSAAIALLLQWVVLKVGGRLARRTPSEWDDHLVLSVKGPLGLIAWALLLNASAVVANIPDVGGYKNLLVRSLTIIGVVWFALRVLKLVTVWVGGRDAEPGGRYRSIRTQFEFTRRLLEFGIWLIGSAIFLLQFDVVRNVGVSLLASAGIGAVVLGLAAQKSFASLFAGIQLSITQPIRIGDAVVIEKEYGTVAEIRFTYVVVRTWDNRRLIVPIAYFLDKTFENWSLAESTMLSTVILKVDFTADVDAFREEIARLLCDEKVKAMWDGKTSTVHVTDADDKTVTLRLLVGACDPDRAFDLRCLIREGLIRFLASHPQWLPRARSEFLASGPILE